MTTNPTREESVQRLIKEGFRVGFSNENLTVLSKKTGHSLLIMAQVDSEGLVNTETLEDFLCKLLN